MHTLPLLPMRTDEGSRVMSEGLDHKILKVAIRARHTFIESKWIMCAGEYVKNWYNIQKKWTYVKVL